MIQTISTMVDLLRWRAFHQPDQRAYTFLQDGETEEVSLTYSGLDQYARAIGALLKSLGADGERALLLYPPGLDYITAFFGCLYAGVVAVPVYPAQLNRSMLRLQSIITDAQASIALTTTRFLSHAKTWFILAPKLETLQLLTTDNVAVGMKDSWQKPKISNNTLAILQYTSGSTAAPKGVMLTHDNLLHNLTMIQQCFELTPDSRGVIWAPPYHDMGLIGGVLQPLYAGFPVTLMSPTAFLQRPFRWLQAISRTKATISGGPNFAYDLCVRKIPPEHRELLDLSSWCVAFNGAEPIRHQTLEQFAATFGPCGFRREAFYSCYGLAEATLIVSGSKKAALPIIRRFQGSALEQNRVVEISTENKDTRMLVGCGQTLSGQKIVIANPKSLVQCSPDQVGEIWVSGSSVAQGYWNRLEETQYTFQAYLADTEEGPFLRTGDLGLYRDGELFVTGRLKDLIIIRGRNYYPQDIELTVEQSHVALRPNCCAAFSVEIANEERLVVVQEVERHYRDLEVGEVAGVIRQAIAENHELEVYVVVLVKAGSIPKTSSGKIQRRACQASFLAGSLDIIAISALEDFPPPWHEDNLTREALLAAELKDRQPLLESYLRTQLARLLKVAESRLDPQQSLSIWGLDSLMTIELKNRIEAILEIVIPMASLLSGPSIAQLAVEILARLTEPSSTSEITLASVRENRSGYPLSYGQQALWFLYLLAPEGAVYNIASAVRIRADLEIPALRRAFQALIDRHAPLRTTFTVLHEEPIQLIHENVEVCFQEEDASNWSEISLNERLVVEAHRPFNLERGPLLRVYLFTRSLREHILLLTIHHIVADFWSLEVLLDELGLLYQAERSSTQADLPFLNLRYTDYVRWQTEMLVGAEGERLSFYWQRQLTGAPYVLNLPTDRPRPAIQTYRGASHAFRLNEELTRRLKLLSKTEGVTLYMTFLAAFQVLLYRYTGQDDILVGSPTAGRNRAKLANLVGYFANPVVLRSNLSGDMTFRAFLKQVRQTVLDAFDHQDYPFASLVERLQPERDVSRSPLFQVMFVLQKAHLLSSESMAAAVLGEAGARINVGGLPLETIALEMRGAQFDLTLMMAEVGGEVAASLQYNIDLFEASTMARMAGHFQTLLVAIVNDPEKRLGELALLTGTERKQLLVDWNASQAGYPKDICIHQLIESQVMRTPEAVAVVFENEHLTYQQLNRRANQLAHHLRRLGVGPEVLVGICMERSLEMVVGLLATLKAGGAYVPLDPTYPRERLSFMIEDARVPVLLTQQRLRAELPEHKARVVCLDADWDAIAQESGANSTDGVRADNLAYVIYTSGSTGRPKGVMVTHQNLVHSTSARTTYYREPVTNFLLLSSFAFDSSVAGVFWTLCQGGTLFLPLEGFRPGPFYLTGLIAQNRISHLLSLPSLYALLLEQAKPQQMVSLRAVIVAGESCPRGLIERHHELLSQASFFNEYGPTEGTVWCTVYNCRPQEQGVPTLIGRPISNMEIYLLDARLQPVPVGVPGELHLGGVGLARGYLNRPELTAERFIPHPFSAEPGLRIYKTGDLARYLPDGNIEYLGRLDTQVKLRGFRIELGEIEALLNQHPSVRETVVLAREDVSDGKRLVAYVVPDPVQVPTGNELRRFLQLHLPDYMVPSVFVLLDALPLTPNGKVNGRALPAPQGLRPELEAPYVAPQTDVERTIAAIWRKVLHLEKVGVHDNFFDLGGHSLLIVQVHSKLCAVLDRDVPMTDMFKYPTISSLARSVGQEQSERPSFEQSYNRAEARRELMRRQREFRQGHRAKKR